MKKSRLFRVALIMLPLLLTTFWSFGQTLKVTGTVSEANGTPIPGVNVKVVGSSQGTISTLDGAYEIEVPKDGSLEFVSMGYTTKVVQVNNQTSINVTLEADATVTTEVVVVGYGTQRKEAVTGSVASMHGEEVRDIPSSNITQALQGRISGVEMAQTSTKPGTSMQIRIRGARSLNASNDPLVVLDGIPFAGSIGDIDPNEIKSIDILKDASATAIYGSRGANGVILVTTNKGQKGQKAQFNYSGYYGVKKIFAKYPMMNGPEFVKLRADAHMYTNTVDEFDDVNTDWQGMLYKTGMVTNHDLSISSGTEKGSYNFGVGYYQDEAVVPLQNYSRYSMRASIDQEVAKYFRFGFSSNNSYAINNGNNLGAVGSALSASPIANPFNADGTLKPTILQQTGGAQWVLTRGTLEALGDKYIDQSRAYGTYNTLYGEAKIPGIEGLKYRLNLGLNYRQINQGNYTGMGVFSGTPSTVSSAGTSNEQTINWAIENLLTYDHTFAEKHKINAVVLFSAEKNRYVKSSVTAKDIPVDAVQFYNLGQAAGDIKIDPLNGNQIYQVSGLMSYMGRLMYSYADRYMLSLTYRSDASSRLAPGHQWHAYPAVSAGWNLKNESFMQNITQIDNLKLRVGYGQTSNQSVDPYKTLGLLRNSPYNFGTQNAQGYYVSESPNDNLGWEYSTTWNYGLDFGLFKNRLSGTIEYYVQNTNDVLLSINLPNTSGVNSYYANIGKTQNKGFELSLNGIILNNFNGWTWDIGINLYTNHNKLVALASGQSRDEGNLWFVGHPIDAIYDYQKIGLWQDGDANLQLFEPGGNVGMIKVKYFGDYNADGTPARIIGPDDRQILNLEANFQGGFNTRVAYKGFDLSVIGSFKSGGIVISTLYSGAGYYNNLNTRAGNNVKVDYWTPDNTGAKYPKPGGIQSSDNPKYASTLGYFDASYLKVRTISLGYSFEKISWMKKSGIDKLRIYALVQNPFVMFSPYKDQSGMDPETNSYGNENAAVALPYAQRRLLTIATNTPSTRNYLFGINLTF